MKRTDSHVDSMDAIAQVLDRLREELAVVREVLDEIRDELQWANRNCDWDQTPASAPRRITSMPLDPAATNWAEQLNRYSAADLPDEDDVRVAPQRGHLF